VTVVRATAVLLIVQTFSTAAFSADDELKDRCSCQSSGKFGVALGSGSPILGPHLRLAVQPEEVVVKQPFSWQPQATEKKWIYVVVHHSATDSGSVDSIDAEHRSRKDSLGNPWLGIGYHFVIGNGNGMPDGEVEPTFRWKQQIHGAHSGSAVHNANGIGICLIGNFQEQAPSEKQRTAVTNLIRHLSRRYNIAARLIIGHNTVKPTICPGKFFPLQDVVRDCVSRQNPSDLLPSKR